MTSVRTLVAGACALALYASPLHAEVIDYRAFQWYSAYDHDIRGSARVFQNRDGTWSAGIDVTGINPGAYHFRIVVPTSFDRVPPGTTLKPAGWTPINVCDFVSNGRRTRCDRDGLAMDQLAQYLEYGVVEIWTSPANSRFGPSRKWATAPLFLDE